MCILELNISLEEIFLSFKYSESITEQNLELGCMFKPYYTEQF